MSSSRNFTEPVVIGIGSLVIIFTIAGWLLYYQIGQQISLQRSEQLHTVDLEQLQRSILRAAIVILIALVCVFLYLSRSLRIRKQESLGNEKLHHELAKSEKIYRTLSSSIPGTAITILDPEERYLLAEGDLLKKMGYKKEDMPGRLISDIITAENYVYYKELIDQAFGGKTVYLEKKTLSGFDTLLRVVPLRDKDEIFAIMFAYLDVTDLKKAQSELAVLNESLERQVELRTEELRELNRELESFSYSVSHDLRSPLRAIIGYSEMLLEDYKAMLDDTGNGMLSAINRNTSRMSQLIDDLLHFSKLGRTELVKRQVDMNSLVSEVVRELLPAEGRRQINLHQGSLPPASADGRLLRQVWLNLISNALKYSRKKEVAEIEIGSIREDDMVKYYVRDNGAGFDMAYADKLFGVFQRLHKATDFEGTGIGLALVQRIIKKHHGDVGAEAKPNEGAKFFFTLPYQASTT